MIQKKVDLDWLQLTAMFIKPITDILIRKTTICNGLHGSRVREMDLLQSADP